MAISPGGVTRIPLICTYFSAEAEKNKKSSMHKPCMHKQIESGNLANPIWLGDWGNRCEGKMWVLVGL